MMSLTAVSTAARAAREEGMGEILFLIVQKMRETEHAMTITRTTYSTVIIQVNKIITSIDKKINIGIEYPSN
jgi:hypothetical protein